MIGIDRDNFAGLLVGLVLPAAQSFVTGVFVFLFTWTIGAPMWEYAEYNGIHLTGTPLLLGLSVGTGTAFIMWLNLRSRWHNALEILLGADLNQDGTIGGQSPTEELYDGDDYEQVDVEPVPMEPAKNVKVFVHQDNHTKVFDLPVDHDVLVKVANLLLQRRVFTYADFSGPGKLLMRKEFEAMRQEFVSRGILLRGQEKNAPASLTRAGAATMRAIIAQAEQGSSIPG